MSYLTDFLDKSISLPWLGKNWIQGLCANLASSARELSYVETVGSKADTLHKYISLADERLLKKAYELFIRKILRKLNLKKVELAIDTKKDAYYGKETFNVRTTENKGKIQDVWEYVVVSIVHPVSIPLMAIRYPMSKKLASLTIELLEYVHTLNLKVNLVLFDRGFYNAELIDYLESNKGKKPWPYQILAPQDRAIKRYVEQTKSKCCVFEHQFKYSKKKSNWKPTTNIVVCKNAGQKLDKSWYDMVFATNMKPSFDLVKCYKRRWAIETGFRVMEEGRIRTRSNKPTIRLFYFLLRAFFYVVWTFGKITRSYFTFKRFLWEIEHYLLRFVVYKPPPLLPIY